MLEKFDNTRGSKLLRSTQRFCFLVLIVEVHGDRMVNRVDLHRWFTEQPIKKPFEINDAHFDRQIQVGKKELCMLCL